MLTETQRPKDKFDVTVILNVHDERKYITRTLLSLEEAAKYARSYGISVEIVVVLDKPAPGMREWLRNADLSAFAGSSRHVVEFGSLGLARNHGLDAANGTYIMTADADDLVSFNYISNFFFAIKKQSGNTICFPQYYYSFGELFHIYKIKNLEDVSPLTFIDHHPYVSRIFCLRSLALDIRFEDLRLSKGYAYEDWHFNITAVTRGIDLVAVPDTIIFYRQRKSGLMRNADAVSARVTPPSPFFKPKTYLGICGPYVERLRDGRRRYDEEADVRREFLASRTLRELTISATSLEPGIDLPGATRIYAYANANGDTRPGACYYQACQIIGDATFTDVLMVPFLSPGGGEKFILGVINTLARLDPSRRLLVIAGQASQGRDWSDQLPPNAVYLDLFTIYRNLGEAQRQVATLRILQSVARGAVVHLKSCAFVSEFIRRFGFLLEDMRLVYYRFCDAVSKLDEGWVRRGYEWDFISEWGELFDTIITDHSDLAWSDSRLLDMLAPKYRTLSLPAMPPSGMPQIAGRRETRKLLWASRLDEQKRPDLLPIIAEKLKKAKLNVSIFVYGSPVIDSFDVKLLGGHSNLHYFGPFNGFQQLPYRDCDGLLYTSSFDGLPNIILEAMAAGLVVFAPDIGGISEAVNVKTGFLIPNELDDVDLASAYVAAIQRFYKADTDRTALRLAAQNHILTKHHPDVFTKDVAQLFGLDTAGAAVRSLTNRATERTIQPSDA